jgi:hypothetical protein
MNQCKTLALLSLLMLCGCATTGTVSPGATLLSGLNEYQEELQHVGNSPQRWPDRQRAAGALKTVITATVGGSPQFYRLVDLDIRKREFIITLRDGSVRPDRMQEMKDELVQMDEEILRLKAMVRSQIEALPLAGDLQQRVEKVATLGMLTLAVDKFSTDSSRGLNTASTRIDQYLVTDLGPFATVRAADGQTHRCALFGIAEEGAEMRCEALK